MARTIRVQCLFSAVIFLFSFGLHGFDKLAVEPAHALAAYPGKIVWDSKELPYSPNDIAGQMDLFGAFVVADFNHDGRLDIARVEGPPRYPNDEELKLSVALQQADGSFVRTATLPLHCSMTWRVLAADINEDGRMDVLVEDSEKDMILVLGNGDGTFADEKHLGLPAGTQPVLARFDSDKHLSLVAGSNDDDSVMVFSGDGNGTFSLRSTLSSRLKKQGATALTAGQIMVADVNGDGRLDIVVAAPTQSAPAWTGQLDLYLGLAGGGFADPVTTPGVPAWRGVLGDFNGDGIVDYAGTQYGGRLEIWLGQPDSHFVKAGRNNLPYAPIQIFAADMNRDGILDLVLSGELGNSWATPVMIFLGKGDGNALSVQTRIPFPEMFVYNIGLQVVDFNGDGWLDLATAPLPAKGGQSIGVSISLNQPATPNLNSGWLVTVHRDTADRRILETSPDLIQWTPLATNHSPVSVWSVMDTTGVTQTNRFYRTR